MQYFGIDCGRDSIKAICYKEGEFEKFNFSSKFVDGYDLGMLENISILNFNIKEHIIARINDEELRIYGKFCNKLPPELTQLVISDDRYIKYSLDFILVAIAELMDYDDEVIVGLNLTANNINYKKEIKDYFLGKTFNVKLYNNIGKVVKDINIKFKEVGVWFQGWTSYLNYAINDNFDVELDYVKQDVLLIDIGRATLDCVYISELSNVKTMAFNYGMEVLYNRMIDLLYNKYNVKKSTIEISNILLNNKKIYDKNGKEIDINEILEDRVNKIGNEMYNVIYNNFSNYSYDKVYLTGGGSFYFDKKLKEMFSNLEVIEDPVFSNAKGLIKMIVRKFLKGKKGQNFEDKKEIVINQGSIFD